MPGLASELSPQTCLHLLPDGERTVELIDSRPGQTKPAFSAVAPSKFFNPAVPGHDVEGSGESGGVHCQNFSELSLMNCSGNRQGLQDRELGRGKTEWAHRLVIVL